jgi:hypothetical protein
MTGIVIIPEGAPEGSLIARRSELVVVAGEPPFGMAIAAGAQGPAGRQGPIGPSGGSALTAPAGEALGGHRIVYLDSAGQAFYASNQVVAHGLVALGLTLGAVSIGGDASILRSGDVTEPSWSWTLEQPVYLGDNGLLTQTPPASPAVFQRIVGFPVTSIRLIISFREPIYLV